eukprot:RCo053558
MCAHNPPTTSACSPPPTPWTPHRRCINGLYFPTNTPFPLPPCVSLRETQTHGYLRPVPKWESLKAALWAISLIVCFFERPTRVSLVLCDLFCENFFRIPTSTPTPPPYLIPPSPTIHLLSRLCHFSLTCAVWLRCDSHTASVGKGRS